MSLIYEVSMSSTGAADVAAGSPSSSNAILVLFFGAMAAWKEKWISHLKYENTDIRQCSYNVGLGVLQPQWQLSSITCISDNSGSKQGMILHSV